MTAGGGVGVFVLTFFLGGGKVIADADASINVSVPVCVPVPVVAFVSSLKGWVIFLVGGGGG